MYSVDPEKTRAIEGLIRRSYIYAHITHYALIRQKMSDTAELDLDDQLEDGKPFKRKIRFNYQDPYELYMFDRLLLPRIQTNFESAARLGVSYSVMQNSWSDQTLFAIKNGGVQAQDFSGITAILEGRKVERERLRSEGVVPMAFDQLRYA